MHALFIIHAKYLTINNYFLIILCIHITVVCRTPAEGSRPTSRGSVGGGPLPKPEYSESLPTSRPGSGGRPSSKLQFHCLVD